MENRQKIDFEPKQKLANLEDECLAKSSLSLSEKKSFAHCDFNDYLNGLL
jgi:hypothetical protein